MSILKMTLLTYALSYFSVYGVHKAAEYGFAPKVMETLQKQLAKKHLKLDPAMNIPEIYVEPLRVESSFELIIQFLTIFYIEVWISVAVFLWIFIMGISYLYMRGLINMVRGLDSALLHINYSPTVTPCFDKPVSVSVSQEDLEDVSAMELFYLPKGLPESFDLDPNRFITFEQWEHAIAQFDRAMELCDETTFYEVDLEYDEGPQMPRYQGSLGIFMMVWFWDVYFNIPYKYEMYEFRDECVAFADRLHPHIHYMLDGHQAEAMTMIGLGYMTACMMSSIDFLVESDLEEAVECSFSRKRAFDVHFHEEYWVMLDEEVEWTERIPYAYASPLSYIDIIKLIFTNHFFYFFMLFMAFLMFYKTSGWIKITAHDYSAPGLLLYTPLQKICFILSTFFFYISRELGDNILIYLLGHTFFDTPISTSTEILALCLELGEEEGLRFETAANNVRARIKSFKHLEKFDQKFYASKHTFRLSFWLRYIIICYFAWLASIHVIDWPDIALTWFQLIFLN